MCGLVGMIGNITSDLKKVFTDMLLIDTIRGPHSTGVMTVGEFGDKDIDIIKQVGTAFDLTDCKAYEEAMLCSKVCLMGHNRWATKGKITRNNAHPFECGNLIGAHNGTLRNQSLLCDYKLFPVDSENIYHHMNIHGLEDTIKNLNGAFALTWWNKDEETINFIRNNERPLFFCYTKDRKTLLWASEGWMIVAAAVRNKVELTGLVRVEPLTHYKIGLTKKEGLVARPYDIEDVVMTKMEEYKAPFVHTTTSRGSVTTGTISGNINTTKSAYNNVTTLGKSSNDVSAYADYVGTKVEFLVQGSAQDPMGSMYIDAVLLDDTDINLRLYVEHKSSFWDSIVNSAEVWQCVAKRFSGLDGGYLLGDLRTLVELPGLLDELEEEGNDPTLTGFQGRQLTAAEYEDRTSCGCGWCASQVGLKEAKDLLWVSDTSFLCPDCKTNPDVMRYYQYIGD